MDQIGPCRAYRLAKLSAGLIEFLAVAVGGAEFERLDRHTSPPEPIGQGAAGGCDGRDFVASCLDAAEDRQQRSFATGECRVFENDQQTVYCRKIRLDSLQRVPEQAVMAAVFVMLKYMIR